MADIQKDFSVRLDAELVERLQKYTDENACDINWVIDEALLNFFQREGNFAAQLIHGYLDMADINEELSNAFLICEQEADRSDSGDFN
ncbi:antitoxin [Bombilactobacillus bombi]|uniref:antitoxin n=1 Tax=Bombilactobacillus bombi TaxID=1303590 RepID=UPI0015E5B57E|nr:antitoxin [Bombilactobacillus bombi]MBA1434265.1 antitoxin [Bombilactobacillus bombi]